MVLLEKIKESAISVIPVMLVVCLLHFTAAPLGDALGEFLVGGVLLILGLSVFVLGADIGVLPVGQKAGSALTSRRNLPLLLGAGFVIGLPVRSCFHLLPYGKVGGPRRARTEYVAECPTRRSRSLRPALSRPCRFRRAER